MRAQTAGNASALDAHNLRAGLGRVYRHTPPPQTPQQQPPQPPKRSWSPEARDAAVNPAASLAPAPMLPARQRHCPADSRAVSALYGEVRAAMAASRAAAGVQRELPVELRSPSPASTSAVPNAPQRPSERAHGGRTIAGVVRALFACEHDSQCTPMANRAVTPPPAPVRRSAVAARARCVEAARVLFRTPPRSSNRPTRGGDYVGSDNADSDNAGSDCGVDGNADSDCDVGGNADGYCDFGSDNADSDCDVGSGNADD